jgi:hypothetical protein
MYRPLTVRRSMYTYTITVRHYPLGAGIFAAPLVSTQFSQLQRWSFHYLVSLGLTLSNILILFLVFRGKTQDGGTASQFNLSILPVICRMSCTAWPGRSCERKQRTQSHETGLDYENPASHGPLPFRARWSGGGHCRSASPS